jgi:hypothetical protein
MRETKPQYIIYEHSKLKIVALDIKTAKRKFNFLEFFQLKYTWKSLFKSLFQAKRNELNLFIFPQHCLE